MPNHDWERGVVIVIVSGTFFEDWAGQSCRKQRASSEQHAQVAADRHTLK